MTGKALSDCRITVRRRTARWSADDVSAAAQAGQFYRSAWPLGTTLQVTDDQQSATRAQFDDYWTTACEQVQMDDKVRRYLHDPLALRMINPFLGLPFRPLLTFLTAGFLAPVFRDALGVPWGPAAGGCPAVGPDR